jgi:hypothetical protein
MVSTEHEFPKILLQPKINKELQGNGRPFAYLYYFFTTVYDQFDPAKNSE